MARVAAELGSVDILVNNAGTLDHVGQFHDQRLELWERDLRVNLTGAFNCAQAVWPQMRERGWGRIVNMASVAGTLGGFGQASYSTTKAGILGLTRTLAMEGGRHGITCNAIVPGIIGTEAFHMANPAMNERIANRTVFKRPGRAAGHRECDRLPVLRPRRLRHGHRAERLRRRRALRLLTSHRRAAPVPRLHFCSCHPARPASRVWRAADAHAASRCAESSSRSASSRCSGSSRRLFSRDRRAQLAAGTTVGGLDVGGMAPAAATATLESRSAGLSHAPVEFVAGGRTFSVTASQLGVRPDWAAAVRSAGDAGRGFGPVRGLKRLQARIFGSDVDPRVDVYPSAVRYTVDRIAAAVDRPARRRRPRTARARDRHERRRALVSGSTAAGRRRRSSPRSPHSSARAPCGSRLSVPNRRSRRSSLPLRRRTPARRSPRR